MVYKALLIVLIFFITMPLAHAVQSDFIQWHTSNIQLLRGDNYKLGSEQRNVMTLEYANGWKYGDFFIFGEQVWSDKGKSTYYIEPTLRFSLSKMLDQNLSYGLIKDVLISAQIEKPKNQDLRRLAGVGLDLNLSGIKFFKSNFFIRDNPSLPGTTYQITLVWNVPFQIVGANMLFEGFTDIAGGEGNTVAHQLIVPRLLIDAGQSMGLKKNTLWFGVEWQYWHNKFGNDGVTESVPQLQMKYIF
jgi:nucleoside-specific outer membrane channel protein Tsx